MKLFLESAPSSDAESGFAWAVVDGVVLDPAGMAGDGRSYRDAIAAAAANVSGPIFAPAQAAEAEGLVQEGRTVTAIAEGVVVVLPPTPFGISACATLTDEGIATCVALCFSPGQALLAAKAGATYVSIAAGQLDDIGHDGMQLVREVVQIYDTYDFATQLVVALVRHPKDVVEAALIGADAVALPVSVLTELLRHPLTEAGLQRFLADLRSSRQIQ